MGRTRALGTLALTVAIVAAACQPDMFACASDEACAGLEGGACEANGLCSIPNGDCASGRVFAPHSGELSGECVPAADGTTTGPAATSVDPPSGPGDTGPVVTTAVGGTTSSSTGGGGDTTGDATTGGAQTDTGAPAPAPCGDAEGVFVHDFARGELPRGDWSVSSNGTGSASVDSGQLEISVAADGSGAHFWWVLSSLPLPTAGSVAFEVIQIPPPDSSGFVWVSLVSAPLELSFEGHDGELRTAIRVDGGGYVEQTTGPFDPVDDRWMRIRYDADSTEAYAETSADGLAWSPFFVFDASAFDFTDFAMGIGGGVNGSINGSMYTGVVGAVATAAACGA